MADILQMSPISAWSAGLQSLEWWDRSEWRRRVLGVDKVGGQVSFAFHVDYSSQSNIVSHTLDHLGSLLRHLEEVKAEDKKVHNDKYDNTKILLWELTTPDLNIWPNLLGLTAYYALINVSLFKKGSPKVLWPVSCPTLLCSPSCWPR